MELREGLTGWVHPKHPSPEMVLAVGQKQARSSKGAEVHEGLYSAKFSRMITYSASYHLALFIP